MSKRIQARVRQRTQATTDGSAPASSRYASLLERTFAIYQSGGTELPTDLAAEWEAALAADRESLLAFIVQPIAAGLIEPRLAQLVLGSDNKYTALATDWAAVAAFTGYRPAGFNRYESGKSLDALAAKQSGAMTPATGSWAAMAAAMEAQRGMGAMLRAWHEREFPFGQQRDHGDRDGDVRSRVSAAIAEATKPAAKPPEPTLEQKLASAEADEAKAVAEKRYSDAEAAAKSANDLRKQIEAAKTPPAPTAPAVNTNPPPTNAGDLIARIKRLDIPASSKQKLLAKALLNDDDTEEVVAAIESAV
ncbi:MAG: hypothetical protein A3I96_00300 [Candidatus Yanofskybacteria bacterium RIFCSPLOWO2_02_FULL_44_18]|uniref:Uncharacterized protein n=1 Tax=Candidatus Yanofskybacteria bacterium RIFCSPLOWO2_02_FULL_44_18 TaxID=1802705 RepID=A0A1F8H0T4_9BACT|nr:MAG: hypothetical protein A3I96_00300 [Candidatus Yanofskybacteria bacterium RIFCSPLOWO2_02_FULL_44_18]